VRKHANNAPQSDDIALVFFGRVDSATPTNITSTRMHPVAAG
jgi:hypothetical protein